MSQQNIDTEDRFANPAYRQVVEAANAMAARMDHVMGEPVRMVDRMTEAVAASTRPVIEAADRMNAQMEAITGAARMVPVPVPAPAELAQYVEPQPTGGKPKKIVKELDHVAAKVRLYDQAVREYNELGARIKALQAEIAAEMDDANSAVVAGVEVFTYNLKNSYRTAELKNDYGDLCQHYMVPRSGMELDIKRFAKDHPGIAERYRTREFRRAGGIQVLR